MKTAVIYYTFGGATKAEAERLAAEQNADCFRIREKKNRSVLNSVLNGCPAAKKRKKTDIQPVSIDFGKYDRIVIGCPIWAGYPAPAFNNILEMIPAGKVIDLFFCSAGGKSGSDEETGKLIAARGCTVGSLRNIRTGRGIVKMKE